jgi:(4S)-4-hydroxy-5-phosphonooxypentane-2,3-dione isomerase
MSKVAIFVTFECKPGKVDEFVELVKGHANRCLEREPGCLQFDVLKPNGGDKVMLYEVYASPEALEAHRRTDHLAMFREKVGAIAARGELIEGALVEV